MYSNYTILNHERRNFAIFVSIKNVKMNKQEVPNQQDIKKFFLDFDEINDKEALRILKYLYSRDSNEDLLTKFKDEIALIINRINNEISSLKEEQELEGDLKQRLIEYESQLEKWKDGQQSTDGQLNMILKHLQSGFISNKKHYSEYLQALSCKLYQTKDKVKHVIIYEAPPCVGSYILGCGKDEYTKISTYWKPIEAVLSPFDCNETPSQNMANNLIGFIDLTLVPLPLKQIREDWSTSAKFKIDEKQLPVWLFQWAIEDFIEKINDEIETNPLIAIGMPNKTSVSIFDYYALLTDVEEIKAVKININETNEYTKKRFDETGLNKVNLRLYKSNVTSGMGFPNGLLMKVALEKNIKERKE
jgi:hypothetical protein